MHNISSNKVLKSVLSSDGITGDNNITNYRMSHFENIYCAPIGTKSRDNFLNKINSKITNTTFVINVNEVELAIMKQKENKAVGPDGLSSKAFWYGSHNPFVMLTVCLMHVSGAIICLMLLCSL